MKLPFFIPDTATSTTHLAFHDADDPLNRTVVVSVHDGGGICHEVKVYIHDLATIASQLAEGAPFPKDHTCPGCNKPYLLNGGASGLKQDDDCPVCKVCQVKFTKEAFKLQCSQVVPRLEEILKHPNIPKGSILREIKNLINELGGRGDKVVMEKLG
jgi:hypothetical protein